MQETAADRLITVTDATFADTVLASDRPVLVDFWAEWCPPCRPVSRILAELADEFAGQLVVATLNYDENPASAQAYRVLSLPTMLLFRGGGVVTSIVGARSRGVLRSALLSGMIRDLRD